MRKRMMQLAKGKFDYVGPNLSFSVDQLEASVLEGRDYAGTFTITSSNQVPFQGIVYSSNPRMEVLTPQFEGEEARVRFQFHSEGLSEGDIQKGDFHIVCNLREYSLPFCVSISKLYAESSQGKITNLYEFAKLAKTDWKEAYQLFYSTNFPNIIKSKEVSEALLYRGLSEGVPCNQNLEEFLIGIGKKEKVMLSLEKNAFSFYEVKEQQKEFLSLKKEEWGFLLTSIESDADFLIPLKREITQEDFLGSSYHLEYFIDPGKMHAGKNYGRITISTVYQKLTVEIMATFDAEVEEVMSSVRSQIKQCKSGVLELYQAYRLKRIVTGQWANESIRLLDQLIALEENSDIYSLMKAQVYIINKQRQEADWLLEDYKHRADNHKTEEWGYYLYILSLLERDIAFVNQTTKEVEAIFRENPDSVFLFWILTFLKEEYYHNNGRKLKDIAYWIEKGCTSPYLYVEAYYLIWQEPFLLTKLSKFELKIMRWAMRHNALTKDIAGQIFEITANYKNYDELIFELLCASYQVYPKEEHLIQICSYLIKCEKYEYRYHGWFELGIKEEVRLAGLYEAFLLSLDPKDSSPLPKIIQMYFQYETTIPYQKLAVLYGNIIAGKKEHADTYQKYQKAMGRFAMAQAEARHIDDNLSLLYEDMLDIGLIDEEIARGLSKILFTKKLVVYDKRMVRAIVYERKRKEAQIVAIHNHQAYVTIPSEEYVILFEDKDGRRYGRSMTFQLEALMNPEPYLEKCMNLVPDEMNYVLHRFDAKQSYLTFEASDEKYFSRVLFAEDLSQIYQAEMIPEILRYYKTKTDASLVEQYLEKGNLMILDASGRSYVLDLLVDYGMYEKAYEYLLAFGIDQAGTAAKVSIASVMIERLDGKEEDFLTALAKASFLEGKYNNVILKYLANYMQGSNEEMISLWKVCMNFDIYSLDLSERILVQMLYVNHLRPEADDIFRFFYEQDGKELIVLAYISLVAHSYFVYGEKMSPYVAAVIEMRYRNGNELNDACRLALFHYLANLESPTDLQYKMVEVLLATYVRRNMYFAFYKQLDKRFIQKYHLYDKIFLEYRTNPNSHVVLHYSGEEFGDGFVTEEMPNVYDGIFVKQFAMFFGDVIQYYISDELNGSVKVLESTRITNNDLYGQKDDSRYHLINQMLISQTLQDNDMLYHNMKQYQGMDSVVDQLFKLL